MVRGTDKITFFEESRMTVEKIFAELEAWFMEHAPKAAEVLLPGATPDDIAALERVLGVAVPAELRSLFSTHNGQRPRSFVSTIDGCTMLSCKGSGKAWTSLGELLDAGDLDQPAESKDGKVKPVWWSRKWVPFAEGGSGDMLCVDLDPTALGTTGQVIKFYHDEGWRDQLAPTVDAFLESYLHRLRQGKYKLAGTGGIQPT
jgi:cell wall assembly regulator SMI1